MIDWLIHSHCSVDRLTDSFNDLGFGGLTESFLMHYFIFYFTLLYFTYFIFIPNVQWIDSLIDSMTDSLIQNSVNS